MLCRKYPWLPQQVAEFKFPRSLSQKLLKNIRRVTVWLEKIVRSRWKQVADNSYTWRSNGFCIAWLSILLMLPIPFTNPLPAIAPSTVPICLRYPFGVTEETSATDCLAILLLAVATLEADGLLMCIGYCLTLVNTIFFGFIGYALWQARDLLSNLFS